MRKISSMSLSVVAVILLLAKSLLWADTGETGEINERVRFNQLRKKKSEYLSAFHEAESRLKDSNGLELCDYD